MSERFNVGAGNKPRSHEYKVGSFDLNVSLISDFNGRIFGNDASQFWSRLINVKVHVWWYVDKIPFDRRQINAPSV